MSDIVDELNRLAKPEDAVFLQRYFKTGKGEYGEGDIFIGLRVPQVRLIAKQFKDLPIDQLEKLLNSKIHEHRLCALIIAANQYKKADAAGRKRLYDFYISGLARGKINNWDLVDVTCWRIVGEQLRTYDDPGKVLNKLASSESLWERRAAVMASGSFILAGDPTWTLEMAETLIHDKEDLIHKATGWMLREVGKRIDKGVLVEFLDKHAREMPRTMLRYAIEHFGEQERRHYLNLH